MPVYLITPLGHNVDQVGTAIRIKIPAEDRFELQNRAGWLVRHRGTSVEVSNDIGITPPDRETSSELGSAMVTSVGSYYGRGPTTMWEWLKTRFEAE